MIVDESARGQGVGEALVREGMRLANEAGVLMLELTSMPYRQAANRLYRGSASCASRRTCTSGGPLAARVCRLTRR